MLDIPLNLIRNKIVKLDKGKEFFYRSYQMLLIDPKNGQGELTTLESNALVCGIIFCVHRINIYV